MTRRAHERLRVALVTSEFAPLACEGGVSDTCHSLARALIDAGHEVRVILPWYRTVARRLRSRRVQWPFQTQTSPFRVGEGVVDGIPFSLVGHRWIRELRIRRFDALGPTEAYLTYWAFAVGAAALVDPWAPDIVHCHDYWTGLVPAGLRHPSGIVFTVHDGANRGSFHPALAGQLAEKSVRGPLPPVTSARARFVDFLRRGLASAHAVTTVSPSYAAELAATGALPELSSRPFLGILNGIDTARYNPANDPLLPVRYDGPDERAKLACKRALQRAWGLCFTNAPLLLFAGRLDPRKLGPLPELLPALIELGVQLCIMGDGEPRAVEVLRQMERRWRGRFVYRPFERRRETLAYAGADLLLMPSLREPCGLSQLKAMRYGAVPVVHRTGGLADTVRDYRADRRAGGTGFAAASADPWTYLEAVVRALATRERSVEWRALVARVMRHDSSWRKPLAQYIQAYRLALEEAA